MFKKQSNSVKSAEDCALLCSMKRALKSHTVFAKGGAGILVLITPENQAPARYGAAILDELFPDDDYRRDDRGFMYVLKGDKLSKMLDAFRDDCLRKRRAIVVVENGATIPAAIKVGADVVADIPPVTPEICRSPAGLS